MKHEPLLKAENIHKKFGRLHVLQGVNFQVWSGEIAVIEGPSGSGKSTLLNILATLDTPTEGRVYWDGEGPLHQMSRRFLARFRNQHIGFVFQFHFLLPELTALENVMVPALIQGISRREAEVLARNLLEQVGLQDRLLHYPDQLSGGEQQRVAIARALINRPRLIFADEPTGNLDRQTGQSIMELFQDIHRTYQTAFVIVTHNPAFRSLANTLWYLEGGKLQRA